MNYLRVLRTRANLTVQQVADILGVKPVTVYAWESGRNVILPEIGKRLVSELACDGVEPTLDQLYGRVAISTAEARAQ